MISYHNDIISFSLSAASITNSQLPIVVLRGSVLILLRLWKRPQRLRLRCRQKRRTEGDSRRQHITYIHNILKLFKLNLKLQDSPSIFPLYGCRFLGVRIWMFYPQVKYVLGFKFFNVSERIQSFNVVVYVTKRYIFFIYEYLWAPGQKIWTCSYLSYLSFLPPTVQPLEARH